MRFVDAMISMPAIVIALLVASFIRPSLLMLIALISLLSWPEGTRVIRAQVLSLKETGHVHAARTFGAGWLHILRSHIVPELGPILAAIMIQDARRAIFMEAGMSFLGVSNPSMVSWGKMMHQALGFSYLDVWKWWLIPTGVALSATIMGLSFIGSALETALDPRLERSKNKKKNTRWTRCSR
jgi:peptide/nickel transport system permease protein